jgi:hypothetical protein
VQHLKKALEKLWIELDVDFFEVPQEWWGDSKLKTLLENISKVPQTRKVIGIFDRDVEKIVSEIEKDEQSFKTYGNNVYGFCIPAPEGREWCKNISIEFFFVDENLKKERNWKRIYFTNEINFDDKRKPRSRVENPIEDFDKKIADENIWNIEWIHSKAVFADLVEKDGEFISDFDFSKFRVIFERLDSIVNNSISESVWNNLVPMPIETITEEVIN